MNLSDYRNPLEIEQTVEAIKKIARKRWRIMEVCGGQTHSIIKYGIDQLLPIEFLHGPGCPVCVTPTEVLDEAIALARKPQVIFCTFSDMLRVPGSESDLLSEKAKGSNIQIVYSPLDAIAIAEKNPDKEVVFFAVGFETTAPANAMTIYQAEQKKLKNFSLLVSQVLVPPAMEALLSNSKHQIDGFLAAGHVCTITGFADYEMIAQKYKVPIVVTGFEPLDIVQGIYLCVKQLESATYQVENQYHRFVQREGNVSAIKMLKNIFQVEDKSWRGMGVIAESGLGIQSRYEQYDARKKLELEPALKSSDKGCISGEVLQGIKKPTQCPHFGITCLPENPLGATMVSSEGACAAYYMYKGFQA